MAFYFQYQNESCVMCDLCEKLWLISVLAYASAETLYNHNFTTQWHRKKKNAEKKLWNYINKQNK